MQALLVQLPIVQSPLKLSWASSSSGTSRRDIQSLKDVLGRAVALKTDTNPHDCVVVIVEQQQCLLCQFWTWMEALVLHQRARRTKKGTKLMQVGTQKLPVSLINCVSGAKVRIWENLGRCQGQLRGQSEVSVWKRWEEAEAQPKSSGDRGENPEKEVTQSCLQMGKNDGGLTFLVLSASGCLDLQ